MDLRGAAELFEAAEVLSAARMNRCGAPGPGQGRHDRESSTEMDHRLRNDCTRAERTSANSITRSSGSLVTVVANASRLLGPGRAGERAVALAGAADHPRQGTGLERPCA